MSAQLTSESKQYAKRAQDLHRQVSHQLMHAMACTPLTQSVILAAACAVQQCQAILRSPDLMFCCMQGYLEATCRTKALKAFIVLAGIDTQVYALCCHRRSAAICFMGAVLFLRPTMNQELWLLCCACHVKYLLSTSLADEMLEESSCSMAWALCSASCMRMKAHGAGASTYARQFHTGGPDGLELFASALCVNGRGGLGRQEQRAWLTYSGWQREADCKIGDCIEGCIIGKAGGLAMYICDEQQQCKSTPGPARALQREDRECACKLYEY